MNMVKYTNYCAALKHKHRGVVKKPYSVASSDALCKS